MSNSLRALSILAAAQVTCGLAGLGRAALRDEALPPYFLVIEVLVFGLAGAVLTLRAQRDSRAATLGTLFLVVASAFALTLVAKWDGSDDSFVAKSAWILARSPADAFLPWVLFSLVDDFPRATVDQRLETLTRFARRLSAAVGIALVATNLAAVGPLFDRLSRTSHYWTVSYGLIAPALVFAVYKARRAAPEEKRRVAIFVGGVLAAAIPICALVIAQATSTPFDSFLETSALGQGAKKAALVLLFSFPITTAYAVVVDRVIDLRLALRITLRHTLARGFVTGLVLLPFGWVLWQLLDFRDVTVRQLISVERLFLIGGPLLLGVAALRFRTRATRLIDRTFFREKYDTGRILTDVGAHSHRSRSSEELADALISELELALHPERTEVLLLDAAQGRLTSRSGATPGLASDSALVASLVTAEAAVDVPVELSVDRVSLPADERTWLETCGFRVLTPLKASDGSLLGVLGLGARKSGLPYSQEDRLLLAAIADAAALGLENQRTRLRATMTRTLAPESELPPASECEQCGLITATGTPGCPCGAPLIESAVPAQLLDKFRFERRIGRGGMGVVYRAVDVTLDRLIAVKTLPTRSAEESKNLRREARAMARVSHPNLALIYGADTWRGTPLLVVEYLASGTLHDRLERSGPLSPTEVVALGIELASVLGRIHEAGVLHRDVKPSNVGRHQPGDPWKLMDFGVAHLLAESHSRSSLVLNDVARPLDTHVTSNFAGTPMYMSPEAIGNQRPNPSFDLWAAALVLHEALIGRHPLSAMAWPVAMARLLRAELPDVRSSVPGCPPDLAELLALALGPDPSRRPQSANALKEALLEIAGVANHEIGLSPV